jgi:hypothetical protein
LWQNIRAQENSETEELLEFIADFIQRLKDLDGSIESGIFQAAYEMEEMFITSLEHIACNGKVEDYLSKNLKDNLNIYKRMFLPIKIKENERETIKSYAIHSVINTVKVLGSYLFQLVDDLLPFCFNLLRNDLDANIIGIVASLTSKINNPKADTYYEPLCELRDRALESGILDVTKAGISLLGELFNRYIHKTSEQIEIFVKKIVDVFEPEKFLAPSYIATTDVLTNLLTECSRRSPSSIQNANERSRKRYEKEMAEFEKMMSKKKAIRDMIINKFGIEMYNEFYIKHAHKKKICGDIPEAKFILSNQPTKEVDDNEPVRTDTYVEFDDVAPEPKSIETSPIEITESLSGMIFKLYGYFDDFDYSNSSEESAEFSAQLIGAIYRNFKIVHRLLGTKVFIRENKNQIFSFINKAIQLNIARDVVLKEFTNFMFDVNRFMPISSFPYFARPSIIDALIMAKEFLPTNEADYANRLLKEFYSDTKK